MTTTAGAQLDQVTAAAALLRSIGPAAAATVTAFGPADARMALRLAGVVTDDDKRGPGR
ncbi:hypothetical protein [[Mycobacterium] nativiensis]|uniref:Uncharacterized protein n=1 Tax=[Mycobacterium] nativiensis TaxID=2855503 RepID=A0ABU5Y2W1_9MYCO|nr:hypothetical protein [Mycolicibacter sp. MYC340]MEB3034564.1 hypothetical protein [Mycolicibacter sp. MYC340]